MGAMAAAIDYVFPEVGEFKRAGREIVDNARSIYDKGRRIGQNLSDYLVAHKSEVVQEVFGAIDSIVDDFSMIVKSRLQGLGSSLLDRIVNSYSDAVPKQSNIARQPVSPVVVTPAAAPNVVQFPRSQTQQQPVTPPIGVKDKYSGIENLIGEFSEKITPYNDKFKIIVEFYEPDGKKRSYKIDNATIDSSLSTKPALTKSQPDSNAGTDAQPMTAGSIDSIVESASEKYKATADFVAGLYNQGYKSREIRREAEMQGLQGITSYKDILERVCYSIANGGEYSRGKYNSKIAQSLGIEAEVVAAKRSGKTNAEIRKIVANKTKGMGISDTTIRRLVKKSKRT